MIFAFLEYYNPDENSDWRKDIDENFKKRKSR